MYLHHLVFLVEVGRCLTSALASSPCHKFRPPCSEIRIPNTTPRGGTSIISYHLTSSPPIQPHPSPPKKILNSCTTTKQDISAPRPPPEEGVATTSIEATSSIYLTPFPRTGMKYREKSRQLSVSLSSLSVTHDDSMGCVHDSGFQGRRAKYDGRRQV